MLTRRPKNVARNLVPKQSDKKDYVQRQPIAGKRQKRGSGKQVLYATRKKRAKKNEAVS